MGETFSPRTLANGVLAPKRAAAPKAYKMLLVIICSVAKGMVEKHDTRHVQIAH
jgi:hypothetical protein